MRKHGKIWVGALVLAVIGVIWAVWPEPEPYYKGRPLSYWVRSLDTTILDTQTVAAQEAVLAVGTNAIPHLVNWIRNEPSPLREKLEYCIRSVVPARVLSLVSQSSRQRLAGGTDVAFALLGTNAIGAAPELARLAQDASARQSAERVFEALSLLGTNGVKGLLAVIGTPSHPFRSFAMKALLLVRSDLGPCAEAVATPLIRCLDEPPTNGIPSTAAATLGILALAPEISVPALEAKLSTPNPRLKAQCIRALGEFGTQAVHALPLIREALTNSDARVREAAKRAIARIEPTGPADVPAE